MIRRVTAAALLLLLLGSPFAPIKKSNYDVPTSDAGQHVHVVYRWMSLAEYLFGVPLEAAYVPTAIKSVQVGSMDFNGVTTKTAMITAVVVANTTLVYNGFTASTGAGLECNSFAGETLTNTTTVTGTIGCIPASASVIYFTALEYRPGILKSNQYASCNYSSSTSCTMTISSVATAKAVVAYLGFAVADGAAIGVTGDRQVHDILTSATIVTATVRTADASCTTCTAFAEVLEFN